MIKLFVTSLILFCLISGNAKTQNNLLMNSILTDHLNNVYIISDKQITKCDDTGNVLFTFSYINAGPITTVDVSDPLKILVFFKDFNQIIYLDNNLAITQGPLQIQSLEISQPLLACTSNDKGFWIYDHLDFSINKIDKFFQKQQVVPNLPQIIGETFNPVSMKEVNQQLYLYDPEIGFAVFDTFGSYIKMLHFKNLKQYQISESTLFFIEQGSISIIDLRSYTELKFNLPDENFLAVAFSSRNAFLLNPDGRSFRKIELQ
ncbi:MAG: hypothetical protein PHT69_13165 [Bacteroidales bacterium]|nr:hypothetical protein [Bacteroidales bacterium]